MCLATEATQAMRAIPDGFAPAGSRNERKHLPFNFLCHGIMRPGMTDLKLIKFLRQNPARVENGNKNGYMEENRLSEAANK